MTVTAGVDYLEAEDLEELFHDELLLVLTVISYQAGEPITNRNYAWQRNDVASGDRFSSGNFAQARVQVPIGGKLGISVVLQEVDDHSETQAIIAAIRRYGSIPLRELQRRCREPRVCLGVAAIRILLEIAHWTATGMKYLDSNDELGHYEEMFTYDELLRIHMGNRSRLIPLGFTDIHNLNRFRYKSGVRISVGVP